MSRFTLTSTRPRFLRSAALGLSVLFVVGGFASPASADDHSKAAAKTNESCEKSRGVFALIRPDHKVKCLLGIGEREVAASDVADISNAVTASESTPTQVSSRTLQRAGSTSPVAAHNEPLRTAGLEALLYGTRLRRLADCDPPSDLPIPSMVASIFRCRMLDAGFSRGAIEYSTAEAIVVAQCESLFDADAVVFDGKYLDTAHPATGYRYSAAGVFQFIRATADKWIEGGYANVKDPVKNIDAAARLYIANLKLGVRPWSDWACAAANDGFKATSVLPGWPGGPKKLPDWAFRF